MRRPRRLTVLCTSPALAAAFIALSPSVANASAANAAETGCAPTPASAVATALGVDQLHSAGLNGAGLTIGVISTSYNNYDPALGTPVTKAPDDVASGALPGSTNPCGYTQEVKVIHDTAPNDDEGRAMLQIVHAIAPAADLVFTTAGDSDDLVASDQEMAAAIEDMVGAGVDVIVDDIMEEGDLAFASGFAATAAKRATEAGVIYTVAAGNLNIVGQPFQWGDVEAPSTGYSIGSWQTSAFRGTACPEVISGLDPTKTLECMDFDSSEATDYGAEYAVNANGQLKPEQRTALGVLEWGDAPFDVRNAFTAYFLDDTGAVLPTETVDGDATSPYPVANGTLFEGMPTDETFVRTLVIAREVTDAPADVPVRFSFFDDNTPNVVVGSEYYESTDTDTIGSSIVGRAANPSSVTIAAASMLSETRTLDAYSGMGPQTRYFGDVAQEGVAPARLEAPELRVGPTVTGLDTIPTTFFGTLYDDVYYYQGTSAATPVVGAALALAKQSAPGATNDALIDALSATATPITETWNGTTPAQTSGAGLVNPVALVAAVRETPAPAPVPAPAAGPAATLPATGAATDGGLWAIALILLGLASLAGARTWSVKRRSV